MSAPAASTRPRPPWSLLVAVGLGVFLLDVVTKFLAVKHLTFAFAEAQATTFFEQCKAFFSVTHPMPREWVAVVPGFWSHRYVENPGAALSFAGDWPDHVRIPFFLVITPVAVALIAYYYRRLSPSQRHLQLALSFILGGALGNFLDRMVRGYVVDFIDWHLNDFAWSRPELHFPTFNVADAGITGGVALIVLDALVALVRQRRAQTA